MTTMSMRVYMRRYALRLRRVSTRSQRVEYTLRDFVRRFMSNRMNLNPDSHVVHTMPSENDDGSTVEVRQSPLRQLMNDANHAHNSYKDKEGGRIFYHSIIPRKGLRGPSWFHRDDATYEEAIAFAEYLEELGRQFADDAARVRRFARDHLRRPSHARRSASV